MTIEKTGVIYRIYNTVNGKSYIGQTTEFERRIKIHFRKHNSCTALRNAINKYGKESFRVEILESDVPEKLLSKLEILHIRFWNTLTPNGYNLNIGGRQCKRLQTF